MPSLATCAQVVVLLAAGVCGKANLPPIPSDVSTPVQQRIAVHGPNSITVSWNTYKKLRKACVRYGVRNGEDDYAQCALTQNVCSPASAQTYPSSRTYFHSVTITDLLPATKYCYQIVSTNSTRASFQSPRPAGDRTPFTMNAIIDLGVYGEDGYTIKNDKHKRDTIPHIPPSLNHTTIDRLAQTINDYEFIVHPGDLAYADDWLLKEHNVLEGRDAYQAILEQFYDQLSPIAARKPYMASPGNHEASCQEIPWTTEFCPKGEHNFTDFMTRFGSSMPPSFVSTSRNTQARINANKAQHLSKPPFWFSFEYGMAHIVMIDTETDFPRAPESPFGEAQLNSGPFGAPNQQLEFLEADLASVDRTVTPWLIVAGHRPWYTASDSACKPCQDAFEPLLHKYGVDLAIFGHVHNSQRFLPVYKGKADRAGMDNPTAPMYIIAGGAGNIEGLAKVPKEGRPAYTAFAYGEDFAYATVSFEDAQNLRVDFVRSATGEVVDSSRLKKRHDVQFVNQSAEAFQAAET
ncbi:hypothetical protein E4U48_008044 [Claviceps purpurea]|nr:hypothetical protein E4U37_000414 [Claviceps purpurea]KAG6280182.1 hypothetical protein E4U48_008044 [Claviceps purpurea]